MRDAGYGQFYIRFDGTEEDAAEYMRAFYKARYAISDAMEQQLVDLLSTAGWMTVTDLASESGMTKTDVIRVMKAAGDKVLSESRGSTTYYMRRR